MTYTLVNAREMHRKNPESFWAPSEMDTMLLGPGDHAKLCFDPVGDEGAMSERMWVVITEKTGQHTYRGELANQPATMSLEPGDPVEFLSEHIYDYVREQEADFEWARRLHESGRL